MRHKPKWLDLQKEDITWLQSLAPTSKLLSRYQNENITFDEFQEQYLNEFDDNEDKLNAFHSLRLDLDNNIDVCLLCCEKDYTTCHRYILGLALQNEGYEWREL